MKFEYDEQKSIANKLKHGIDFEEAKAIWLDPWLIEIKAKTIDEDRFLLIGALDGKHYSAVVTYRNGATRIISVRRSREEEVLIYESR